MYVYKQTETNLWTVGYYAPDGKWESESDHDTKNDAAKRVHYLNGRQLNVDVLERIADSLKDLTQNNMLGY